MPANSSSKRFSDKIRWTVSMIFFSILTFAFIFFLNDFFRIKEIKIINNDFIIGLEEYKNRNLIFISEKNIEENLLKKNSAVNKVSIEKKYPSTLIINVTVEKPLAHLIASQGFFYLSSQGEILSKSKSPDKSLPLIRHYQKLNSQTFKPGDMLGYKDIIQALNLLKAVQEFGFKIDNVDINGVNMILFNLGDKKIIFSSERQVAEQIYQWQQIIKQFKVEGKAFKEIDLRYDKPIVRF